MYRIGFAILAVVALIAKYFRDDRPWDIYLSKFSYQTNAFGALVLIAGALLAPRVIASVGWDRIRGAAVMYLITTFIVYGFLVNSFDNPFTTSRHWTHTVLHQVIPVVMILDLFIRPFANRLAWRDALRWAIYPVIYLAWSLVRGAIDGWYPYDFIDPGEVGGYGGVALYSIGITAGFVSLGLLIVWVSHWYRRAGGAAPTMRAPRHRAPGSAAPAS
jgi:hypothetical protein